MADIVIPDWVTDKEEREAAEKCSFKHTKYQPTTAEFKCPACKAPAGDFCVDDCVNGDCPLLHEDDNVLCYGKDGKGCPGHYGNSAPAYVRRITKDMNLVPCEHCKGKGFVKKGK